MYSFPLPYHFDPHKPKCLPQHPILEHAQSMFLPQCQKPGIISTQNKKQNYLLNLIPSQTRLNKQRIEMSWLESEIFKAFTVHMMVLCATTLCCPTGGYHSIQHTAANCM